MHMADALIAPAVAGAMYVASGAAAGYSVKKVNFKEDTDKIPLMGVMGAFVFAGQMINFTIPGTGSSGHLCGGLLLSALLGPYAGFLTMIAILLIQCLVFADGGLLALGCNIWNMAFYACFFGYFCIYKPLTKKSFSKGKIALASILGSILSLQLGAFSVVLETQISGITELPFSVFVAAMQPIHLAIGAVEGLITAAVLIFVYEARPELLDAPAKEHQKSAKVVTGILAAVAVLVGGGLSLFASSHPDGLEWSIEKLTGSTELEAAGSAFDTAANIQDTTAFLPDYAFSGSDSAIGTSFSGVVGSVMVAVVAIGLCLLIKKAKNKRKEA